MQFTKLRLQGFKSFVDPTELVIHEGLTGVVGPNGCGKSNLLEALRWVMGESRARAMRGDDMDDVIFAGTDTRPGRGRASVDLVIDNAARLAPAAFNDSDRIEVSRRITRDVGSAYTLNGKTVRARDVQMLFADASTGAHSPALVRQGQIGEIIAAKPRARRRILEEAAGIAGLYQRRHEAELKLNAAGANLGRVEDVLQGLETQLRSLERQAGEARRYREVAERLRAAEAALLLVRWRRAAAARDAAGAALAEGAREAARADAALREAEGRRDAAEGALPPAREEETVATALFQRVTMERAQLSDRQARAEAEIAALEAAAGRIAADLEREEVLGRDAAETLARLGNEADRLERASHGHEAALGAAEDAARGAAELLAAREAELDGLSEEAARLAARTAAAEKRLGEARAQVARLEAEIARSAEAAGALDDRSGEAEASLAAAADAETAARERVEAAEEALAAGEAARAAAQEAEGAARGRAAEAEGALGAVAAECRALERLVARDADGVERMLDRVSVTPGYEAALGAALGDDLRLGAAETGSGWRDLGPAAAAEAPEGAEPLGVHVEAPAALVRRLGRVAVVDAERGAALQAGLAPGWRLVSLAGDLWRWDGFCLATADAPSAAALRLQQVNRLKVLSAAEREARERRDRAAAEHDDARAALDAASAAERAAREERRAAEQAAADASRRLSRAEADLSIHRAKLESARMALAARLAERETAGEELAAAEAAVAGLESLDLARAAVAAARADVAEARPAMLAARQRVDELVRAQTGRERRAAEIARERKGWLDRQENAGARLAQLRRRAEETAAERAAAAAVPAALAAEAARLDGAVAAADARLSRAADARAAADGALAAAARGAREAAEAAAAGREARARLEAVLENAAAAVGEAADRIAEALGTTPEALAAEHPDAAASAEQAEAEVATLRRRRDALGAVNLRAEEDRAELADERNHLAREKADLDEAIAKLRGGIAELNREGRQRLLGAFDQVNDKFSKLFRHLFGGGEARLVMVEAEDPLDAGLEILCQPPGKKLSTLSLLSGGEQTLTALSLIFAVFLSNPAPICVLDEVDAPLDDANVGRFCDLLDEMRRLTDTRFLVITHHATTMSRMDRLFGVTMVERGVSQLVSVDLARAAALVDA